MKITKTRHGRRKATMSQGKAKSHKLPAERRTLSSLA
jgi:hypothetical protein